jgi:hypothetical protein
MTNSKNICLSDIENQFDRFYVWEKLWPPNCRMFALSIKCVPPSSFSADVDLKNLCYGLQIRKYTEII